MVIYIPEYGGVRGKMYDLMKYKVLSDFPVKAFLDQSFIGWLCEMIPHYTTVDGQVHICPCMNCLVRANCTDKCEETMEYVRIVLNDYSKQRKKELKKHEEL